MANPVVRNIHININGKEVVNSYAGISKAMRETNRDIANLNKNDADYEKQLAKHRATLNSLRLEYERTREEIGRVPNAMSGIRSEIKGLGLDLVKGFSIGAAVGKLMMEFDAAKVIIKEFDQAQADLAGVMETTKSGVKGLTEDAKHYGATTSYTATEVSGLQLELAKLGKTQQEIKDMTKGVLDAAVALDAELGPAAELVGGQLNSFGEDASEAQRYADVMANSANISATSFDSLSTALPKVSAVAAQMNISFERTNAVLGVLADQNVAAETSGTGFRNILLTAAKEGRNYEDMLRDVAKSTDATKTATEMFGKENATVAVILSKSFDKVNEATKKLENSVGSAAALAETKLDSVTGSQKLFNSAWEGMILAMDDGNGAVSEATKRLYNMGTELVGLITPSNELSDAIFKEQLELNRLVGEITSTNVSNKRRQELIEDLKASYPGFIEQIDIENASNDALKKTLFQVNEQYRERILLQAQVERVEKIKRERDTLAKSSSKEQIALEEKLTEIITERGFQYTVDYGNIKKSAKEVQKLIKESGGRTGPFSDFSDINLLVRNLDLLNNVTEERDGLLKKEEKRLDKIKETTGLITEEERQQAELAKERASAEAEATKRKKEFDANGGATGAPKSKKKPKKDTSEAESKKLERQKEREKELFDRAEQEINDILLRSQEQRELQQLEGLAREEKQIRNKYAKDLDKYAKHADRLKELEAARDAEIEAARAQRTEEYQKKTDLLAEEKRVSDLEKSYDQQEELARSAEERSLVLIEKAREVALLEIDIEREKELAKVEAVEGAEELKAAIREKYASQEERVRLEFDRAERTLRTQQVDWTKLTEEQKLGAVKNALSGAAEAFNQGSGAWKATKIAETAIATYQSATNSYNSLSGIPIVGPALGGIAAAAAIVSGIKNVQKISQTPLQKMPTYYYGGFTGSKGSSIGGDEYGSFTGMTHANEWVSPAFMTQSPRYAPIINWLDNEREMHLQGVGRGGDNPFIHEAILQALASGVTQLSDVLKQGVVAKNVWGYEDIDRMNTMNKELQTTQKNAKIG